MSALTAICPLCEQGQHDKCLGDPEVQPCACSSSEHAPNEPSEQCTARNDEMEDIHCHGNVGHIDLHWADVSGDGDVTEWGDTDELWEEIDRLRDLIAQPALITKVDSEFRKQFMHVPEEWRTPSVTPPKEQP